MPVDIQKLFNEQLPAALARNIDDAKGIGAKFQLNIVGPTGGEWFVNVTSDGASCKPGNEPADCTVTISDEDFQKLMENPQANAMSLFFAGKLKLAGNTMLAMKLTKLLAYK